MHEQIDSASGSAFYVETRLWRVPETGQARLYMSLGMNAEAHLPRLDHVIPVTNLQVTAFAGDAPSLAIIKPGTNEYHVTTQFDWDCFRGR
jgi:hypothetical protein